jgi:hypothetical protein
MSQMQLLSIAEARLRRRARRYGVKVVGVQGHHVVTAFVADGWLDGYKAALKDAQKVVTKAGGPEHNVGSDIMSWLEEMPK